MTERARSLIERQVDQMVRLFDDLLDVSRITRNKLELRKERVDLAAAVQGAVEAGRPVIQASGHDLVVTLPPAPVYLEADGVRLTQVLLNLLNNAAKYTPKGGVIWLTAGREGNEAVVRVRDTGIGIPAGMLSRIFELFTQVDPSRERAHGGLGIGLTLVRRLVELHGGTVQASSEGPGRGSEFTVRLPALVEPKADRSLEASEAGRSQALRVLIVDDNEDSAVSLALLLELTGHETRAAFDGEEALATAAAFQPDVILLDLGMPRLDGYEAARRIREQPWGKGALLVAMTGFSQEEDRRRSSEAGFDHHMVKPVELDALRALLPSREAGVRRPGLLF